MYILLIYIFDLHNAVFMKTSIFFFRTQHTWINMIKHYAEPNNNYLPLNFCFRLNLTRLVLVNCIVHKETSYLALCFGHRHTPRESHWRTDWEHSGKQVYQVYYTDWRKLNSSCVLQLPSMFVNCLDSAELPAQFYLICYKYLC